MSFQDYVTNDVEDLGEYKTFCGLVSEHASEYSTSPKKWNAVFERFEIPARYVFFDTSEKNLKDLFEEFKKDSRFRGANVTQPYKDKVAPYLDVVENQAKAYNAINTIHKKGDVMKGYNTDGIGEVINLEEKFGSLEGKKVLQLGAGGAGNAISYAIAARGADMIIVNRSIENAESLANGLKTFYDRDFAYGGEDMIRVYAPKVDLILNVSLKGQKGKLEEFSALAEAIPEHVETNLEKSMKVAGTVPKTTGVADIIYNPPMTKTLEHARATGHEILNGENMLVYQAVEGMMRLYKNELEKAGATKEEVTQIMKDAK